jgi:hypothetical protein
MPRFRPIDADTVGLALVGLPFLYYVYLLDTTLNPIEYPDAFAYLWRGPVNVHYFTGRSLTQRVVYTLLVNDARLIAHVQLLLFLATAVVAYLLLRPPGVAGRLVTALGIAGVFSSYVFSVLAAGVFAEPIHVALLVLFHLLLFARPGPRLSPALWVVGPLFVLSKNTAPYLVLFQIGLFLLLHGRGLERRTLGGLGAIAATAVASVAVTAAFDTSLQINLVNNMYSRVFPHPAVTAHFHAKYGMPVGPFVERCRDGEINTPCFDGAVLYRIEPAARNYVLVDDRYGFARWVRAEGRWAWIRYLAWDAPGRTRRDLERGFTELYAGDTLGFFIQGHLDHRAPGAPQTLAEALRTLGPSTRPGFFGWDPVDRARRGLLQLGFGRPRLLLAYLLAGWALSLAFRAPLLLVGVETMVTGLALFFLSFYGDGMEVPRHVVVSLILYTVGGLLYVGGLVQAAASALHRVGAGRPAPAEG